MIVPCLIKYQDFVQLTCESNPYFAERGVISSKAWRIDDDKVPDKRFLYIFKIIEAIHHDNDDFPY